MKTKASHLRVVASGASPSSDPVYPAIERYERANAIYNQVLSRERFGDRSVEWEKEEGEACDRWNEARDEMWRSVPTSRAGALALIKMLFDMEGEDLSAEDDSYDDMSGSTLAVEDTVPLLRTLARALPHIV